MQSRPGKAKYSRTRASPHCCVLSAIRPNTAHSSPKRQICQPLTPPLKRRNEIKATLSRADRPAASTSARDGSQGKLKERDTAKVIRHTRWRLQASCTFTKGQKQSRYTWEPLLRCSGAAITGGTGRLCTARPTVTQQSCRPPLSQKGGPSRGERHSLQLGREKRREMALRWKGPAPPGRGTKATRRLRESQARIRALPAC